MKRLVAATMIIICIGLACFGIHRLASDSGGDLNANRGMPAGTPLIITPSPVEPLKQPTQAIPTEELLPAPETLIPMATDPLIYLEPTPEPTPEPSQQEETTTKPATRRRRRRVTANKPASPATAAPTPTPDIMPEVTAPCDDMPIVPPGVCPTASDGQCTTEPPATCTPEPPVMDASPRPTEGLPTDIGQLNLTGGNSPI